MQSSMLRNATLGFIAAALSVVTVHQLMGLVVTQLGLARIEPWSFRAVPPYGVPAIVNNMFWGGLWGVLFALIVDKLPGGALWLKGLIYGLGIVVISNWILLPLIRGQVFGVPNQVMFAGGDLKRLLAGALILGAFGVALAVIWGLLAKRQS